MDSFKRISAERLPDKGCFYRSLKNSSGKKLKGNVSESDEEYLNCISLSPELGSVLKLQTKNRLINQF